MNSMPHQDLGHVLEDEVTPLEKAAAACHLVLLQGRSETAPDPVVRRARAAAEAHFAASRRERIPSFESHRSSRSRLRSWLVAAGILFLAAFGWRAFRTSDALTPGAILEAVADAGDRLEIGWAAAGEWEGTGASGEVVWSDARQRGVMRFRGLPGNDASVEQYQLWIFDAGRDERYPVDGGVFDVPASGTVDVAIDPRLPVGEATLFAITIEAPGGTVVSTRERLVLVAPVAS